MLFSGNLQRCFLWYNLLWGRLLHRSRGWKMNIWKMGPSKLSSEMLESFTVAKKKPPSITLWVSKKSVFNLNPLLTCWSSGVRTQSGPWRRWWEESNILSPGDVVTHTYTCDGNTRESAGRLWLMACRSLPLVCASRSRVQFCAYGQVRKWAGDWWNGGVYINSKTCPRITADWLIDSPFWTQGHY